MARYGLYGPVSRDLLTYGGRILVHTDRAELEYLLAGVGVVEIPSDIPEEQTIPISQHPELAGLRWPLNRRDFR